MLQTLRNKIGPVAAGIIIGFIAFVFIFFGVYSPRNAGGRGASYAAMVNGEAVTVREFAQAYEQRIRFYEGLMKGGMDRTLLKSLGLRKAVLDELVRQKVLFQQAENLGFVASDVEVADRIKTLPYFQKNGSFDKETYQSLLKANGQTPGRFEDLIRKEIMTQKLVTFFRDRFKVSEREALQDYLMNGDLRQVDYIAVNAQWARKKLGQSAANKKPEEMAKEAEKLQALAKEKAEQIFNKVKGSVSAAKGIAKAEGLEVKTSEKFRSSQGYVSGLGETREIAADAFKAGSDLEKGPKLYQTAGQWVIAWNLRSFKPVESQFASDPKEKEKAMQALQMKKDQQLFEGWLSDAQAAAKVTMNDDILKEADEEDSRPLAPGSQGAGAGAED